MNLKMFSVLAASALALATGSISGCGGNEQVSAGKSAEAHTIPELRFAGVDLIYALRRVSAEAGLLLILDEILPQEGNEDLNLEYLDVDLLAGSLSAALERIHQEAPHFDYAVRDGVLMIRSTRSLNEQTALDRKVLPAANVEVDFPGLMTWITTHEPKTYLRMGTRLGQPVFRRVWLDIPANSSVIDVLHQYAKAVDSGLRIRRAGYSFQDEEDKIVASTVGMWQKLDEPQPLARRRRQNSTIAALAGLAQRTGEVICVVDRSVLRDNRGSLAYLVKRDPGLELEKSIKAIAYEAQEGADSFRWTRDENGVIRVHTTSYDHYLTGRDLLQQEVRGGSFSGSLGELVRWLNRNRKGKIQKVLLGGEILPQGERADLQIEDGTTVEEVLYRFADKVGEGWNLIIKDSLTPKAELEGTWAGAYVTRLADWRETR